MALRLSALLVLLGLPLNPGQAQNAPIPLIPPSTATPSGPTPPTATQPTPRAASPFPEVTNPRAAEKIQVQDLGAIDPGATGALDESQGGFGSDMWAGTDITMVQKALPLLPSASPWRSVRALERKLLLSAAKVPAGKSSGEPLIHLRAAKLMAMGELDGLQALLKGVPSAAVTPDLRRMQADAALLVGDNATACDQVVPLRGQIPDDPFPAKLQVFCQFAAGKTQEAGLGVDLLRETKVNDVAFFTAADAIGGVRPGKVDGFANPTPLTLAMARVAKLALPETVVAGNQPPAILRAIALLPDATLEARLAAAEKAEAVGALDTETLRKIYESVVFSPSELTAPVGAAGTDKGTRSRALLLQAAERQTLPAAKAEIIAKALSLAGDGPGYFTAARLYAPEIAAMKPAPELASFAYPAARALFAAQKPAAAAVWVTFARGQVADGAAALWPLTRLTTDDDRPLSAAILAAWSKGRNSLPPDQAQRRAAVAASLLAAVGAKLPTEAVLTLLDGPPLVNAMEPRPGLWQGLRIATDDLRLGETVMLSLVSLGDEGFTQADPSTLYRVVAALRLIGLDADARALAEEAAIANGV
jgi:hypothetical protein